MSKFRESTGDEWKGGENLAMQMANHVRCEVNGCATTIESVERCVVCELNGCPACVLYGDGVVGRRCVVCGPGDQR